MFTYTGLAKFPALRTWFTVGWERIDISSHHPQFYTICPLHTFETYMDMEAEKISKMEDKKRYLSLYPDS